MTDDLPLVALPADTSEKSGFVFHSLGDKYVSALREISKTGAVMIPAFASAAEIDSTLSRVDGVLMTGAISNVHPPRYGEAESEKHEPYDHARDDLTLHLIRAVIERGMPLFCICRGFQELNVAMGGKLETELQEGDKRLDHRGHGDEPERRYKIAHSVALTKNGFLSLLLGKSEIMVNSVHRQGIKQLGNGLIIEATAPDGVIEAVSVKGARSFSLGTQWHPEFRAAENPVSLKLFSAFGDAVRAHARERQANSAPVRLVV